MKVEIVSVSGLDLFAATIKKGLGANSQSRVISKMEEGTTKGDKTGTKAYRLTQEVVLGKTDCLTVASGRIKDAAIVNRGMGVIHLNAIVTAAPGWFKRAGVSYYPATTDENGIITAGISLSYYRLAGLWEDDSEDMNTEEWDDFFDAVQNIPYFDLFISMDSDEYEELSDKE